MKSAEISLGRKFNLAIKTSFDLLLSLIGVVILSPIYLLTAIMIKITMPGPVFFRQRRVGKDGVEFDILKFRSMRVDTEAEKSFNMDKDAQRITVLGKIIRRTKIDETPQLFNILKGDMSLVGPRPTIMAQVEKYDDFQRQRLNMRPGMTGMAQVNGNVSLPWEDRIVYDVYYVRNFSVLLDLKILCRTVLIVLFGEEKFKKVPDRSLAEKG